MAGSDWKRVADPVTSENALWELRVTSMLGGRKLHRPTILGYFIFFWHPDPPAW
jgi:hypothetical protein